MLHLTPTKKLVVAVAGVSDNLFKYASVHDWPLLSDTTVLEFGEWSECGRQHDGHCGSEWSGGLATLLTVE